MAKRITIYENGSVHNGKVIEVTTNSFDELLITIGAAFNKEGYERLFNSFGGEISQIELLRDDDVIYVSKGEEFIPPGGVCDGRDDWIRLEIGSRGTVFYTQSSTLEQCDPDTVSAFTNYLQEIGSGGINQLPDEILMLIFQFLPTRQLLRTCRLVSNVWRTNSGKICRQRFVRLKSRDRRKISEVWADCDLENFPASNYFLGSYSVSPSERERILTSYGAHLRKLFVREYDHSAVVDTLRSSPNLTELEVEIRCERGKSPGILEESALSLQLPRLKRFNFHLQVDGDVAFLEFMLRQPKLEHVHTEIKTRTKECTEKAILVLNKVPTVSLVINYDYTKEFFHLFLKPNTLNMRELTLSKSKGGDLNLEPLERFLQNYPQLEKVKLGVSMMKTYVTREYPSPFRFPTLPALKTLTVDLAYTDCRSHNGDDTTLVPFVCGFFSLLESNQLPVLHKVSISVCSGCHQVPTSSLTFYPSAQFVSVTELKLYAPRANNDWSQLFPTLKTLEIVFQIDYQDLSFRNLLKNVNLEHLTLQFVEDADATRTIANMICQEPLDDSPTIPPNETSLISFSHLKTFQLKSSYCEIRFDPWVAAFALLEVHPLNHLIITKDAVISDENEEKLKNRHHKYERN